MATTERYIEAVGRRKTATARVRITPNNKQSISVNDRTIEEYFPTNTLRSTILAPFQVEGLDQQFTVTAKVVGGGLSAQSEAVRHGIARALTEYQATLRGALKKAGYLKRDPRMVERKKFGMRKARRAPQWSKR